MPKIIPFRDHPAFQETINLDGVQYRLRFWWNTTGEYWTLQFQSLAGTILCSGIKLVLGYELISDFIGLGLPPGQLWAIDSTGKLDRIGRYDLPKGNVFLRYITDAELLTIAEQLITEPIPIEQIIVGGRILERYTVSEITLTESPMTLTTGAGVLSVPDEGGEFPLFTRIPIILLHSPYQDRSVYTSTAPSIVGTPPGRVTFGVKQSMAGQEGTVKFTVEIINKD